MKPTKESASLAAELRTVITRLIKKLRSRSPSSEGLSLTERSTIALLDKDGPLSPTELATREKITNQSMSAILQHLLELAFIERAPDKGDKRKSCVSLTRAGREKLKKVRSERDEWLGKAIGSVCSQKDQEALRRAIGPLTRIVDFEEGEGVV